MRRTNLLFTLFISLIFAGTSMAQGIVKGVVKDAKSHETLVGATVVVKGTTIGATTNLDGSFSLNVPSGNKTLVISYVGYKTKDLNVTVNNGQTTNLGSINLESAAIGLQEINVLANIAIDRKTPVAVSTVNSATIAEVLGSQELPTVLNRTPGVYATVGSGGYGDSRINIRGFDQRNVAVLINGIPVNDMENGWVYWSNWAGLGDAVSMIQVQRGLGASKLAINSVGGTMNIITKTTDAQKGGSIYAGLTSYGNKKFMIALNTGVGKHGYAITFVGSRTYGPGYIDATYVDAWSYFLSISKQFSKKSKLQFTAIGAPQKHGQRANSQYSAQTFAHEQQWGVKYNPNWGYALGSFLNERNNFYHKPQFALNWYYNISENSFLATSAYMSVGNGGGSGILGRNADGYYLKYGAPQNDMQQRNWDYAIAANASSTTGSYLIMRNSMNNHFWVGVLSTLNSKLSDNFHLIAGLDARKYRGSHYRTVRNLLGGAYWNDAVNHTAKVGDIIAYHDDGFVSYGGLFGQIEYSAGNFDAFVAGSVNNTWYGRKDYYNFARGRSDLNAKGVSRMGYNFKTGANLNISESSNIFFNAGYYSNAPYMNFVYINYSNTINPRLGNESVKAAEFGYGLHLPGFTLNLNAYYTAWDNRWAKSYIRFTAPDGTKYNGNVYYQGLNELHTGLELQAKAKVSANFELGAFASLGNWRYVNDTRVSIYNDANQQKVGEALVYTKGLKVPDAPQTQFGLTGRLSLGNFVFGGQYNYNANLYSRFDATKRTNPNDRGQSYKLPAYGTVNSFMQYNFDMGGFRSTFLVNVYNLFDANYAIEGWDNAVKYNGTYSHSKENFAGFWGFRRNFNFSIKVYF